MSEKKSKDPPPVEELSDIRKEPKDPVVKVTKIEAPSRPTAMEMWETNLKEVEGEYLQRDRALGEMLQKEEINRFTFTMGDVANVARLVKEVCGLFGVEKDEYYAAYVNSIGGTGVVDGEEGDEEYDEEYDEVDEFGQPQVPPLVDDEKKKEEEEEESEKILDDEFIAE